MRNRAVVGVLLTALLTCGVLMAAGPANPSATPAPAKPAAEASKQVEALVTKALADYKAGRGEQAITGLQEAIALIQKETGKNLEAFLPKVPEGWEAGDIHTDSGSMQNVAGQPLQWTTAERSYTRKSDELGVQVQLTSSPLLVGAMQEMAKSYKQNAQMLKMMAQGGNKIELIETGGWTGWRMITKDSDASMVMVKGGLMLTVQVETDDEAALSLFAKAIDTKALGATPTAQAKPAKPQE